LEQSFHFGRTQDLRKLSGEPWRLELLNRVLFQKGFLDEVAEKSAEGDEVPCDGSGGEMVSFQGQEKGLNIELLHLRRILNPLSLEVEKEASQVMVVGFDGVARKTFFDGEVMKKRVEHLHPRFTA